ncbi:hypothetical protein [Nocardioides sp.]|uniref:Uncharacterized protein n=1 Tax=metagenome TaxID=256318 RepID=A0A2P2BX43_9ZZZZ
MTYGENGSQLRTEVATLLRQHRIQVRLGGSHGPFGQESTTMQQREELGRQIGRYRLAVLVWCQLAVRASSPMGGVAETSIRPRSPVDELRYRLTLAVRATGTALPALDELTTAQEFAIVETWRQAARAAALGEHDFAAGLGNGRLSAAQAQTLVTDAAEITRGLVTLDRRYENIPGWENLQGQGRLGRAADVCAESASGADMDYSVDLRGWRPRMATLEGSVMTGWRGVLQAEHNLLVALNNFPNARSLRLILDSQRVLSQEAAVRVVNMASRFSDKWLARGQTYGALVRETRDLGGRVGSGAEAASQGANAIGRLRKVRNGEAPESQQLRHLDRLFLQVDERLCDIIEQGTRERLYVHRVRLPRVIHQSEGLIKSVRERYVPITAPIQTDLVNVVKSQLRPPPAIATPPPAARSSRVELHEAITHRSERRGTNLSI